MTSEDHPKQPLVNELKFDPNDPWILEVGKRRAAMTDEEMLAEWLRNEGSQKDEWPDFGAR